MNISDRDFDTARPERDSTFDTARPERETTFDTEPSFGAGAATGKSDRSAGGRDRGLGAAADAAGLADADEIIDELMPEQVDWERLVRTYPLPAMALAAAAGFYLAVARGPVVVSAITGWATGEMTRRVNEMVGEELL